MVEAADQSGRMLRRQLFWQTEPFAREFDEYNDYAPELHSDPRAFAINQRLTHLGTNGQPKYRAMFFAWLSYYHPDHAQRFCEDVGVEIPPYRGHPEPNDDWSEEAKAAFVKQKRTNWQRIVSVSVAAFAAIGLVATAILLWPEFSTRNEPAATQSNSERSASLGDEEALGTGEQSETESDEQDGEALVVQETSQQSQPRAPVDPVWDEVTDYDWSTRVLRYFYPIVRRSNKDDLLQAASNGNRNAQTLAAIGYHSGTLGVVDHGREVRQYLRPACQAGQGRACTLLGVHYRAGWGVSQSNRTAASYYARGCRLGNQMGCHYEAVRIYRGEGVPQNIQAAIATFRRTCDAGVGYSCFFLALSYAQGASVEQNMDLARQYYEQSRRLEAPDRSPPFDEVFRPVPAQ